jgi:hypothetical protein
MSKGIDCATPLTSKTAAAFKQDGYDFACRYLVPSSSWKALRKAEAEAISDAGMQIVSVFETTAVRALGGRAAGRIDGETAVRVAKEVGQPEGSTIYFAVDFDARPSQMDTVIEYIRGASEASPGFVTGVYGSYAVVQALRAAGACSRFWQTYAWSRGQVADGIHVYQYNNGPTGQGTSVNGVNVDLNESYGDEGWWNTLKPEVQPVALPATIANNIIDSYLSKTWFSCDEQRQLAEQDGRTADAEAWLQLRNWQNHLANELRKASGQETQ